MSQQNTQSLNEVLRLVGENGLDGVQVSAKSATEAILVLTERVPRITLSPTRILAEFRRQDLMTILSHGGIVTFQLTIKGIHRLQRAQIRAANIPSQNPWDKHWRMVLFDIPNRHADSRYLLTSELKRLGFVMLQSSAWVHPYPCFNQINTVIQYANIQSFVTFLEISSIDMGSQKKLFKHYPQLLN